MCVFMFLYPFIFLFLITSRITHTYVSYFRLIFHFGRFQFSFHLIQFCCWFRLWSIWDFNWETHWWSMMIHDDDDLQMIIELYHLQAKLLFSFSDEILFQRHRVPKLNEKKPHIVDEVAPIGTLKEFWWKPHWNGMPAP